MPERSGADDAGIDSDQFLQGLVPNLKEETLANLLHSSTAGSASTLTDPQSVFKQTAEETIKALLKVEPRASGSHHPDPVDGRNLTQAQRRRLEAVQQAPWKRAPNTGIFPRNAESSVAHSLLSVNPSPFDLSKSLSLTEEDWDEEGSSTHWLIDDGVIFYRDDHSKPLTAEQSGRKTFFDINIVMPVVLPGSEIQVINPDGEHYYNFGKDNPGAHLLFGCERKDRRPADGSGIATKSDANGEAGSLSTPLDTDDPNFAVKAPGEQDDFPAVCDIWASFLNVRLGTIRNCRADQIPDICSMFFEAFSKTSAVFEEPVKMIATGIFPSSEPQSHSKNGPFRPYETRAAFADDADRGRFRILRRRIKHFALMLWDRFGVDCEGPQFGVHLHNNCRTNEGATASIEIRRYTPLAHPGLVEYIRKPQGSELPMIELPGMDPFLPQAKIQSGEIRLELSHARSVRTDGKTRTHTFSSGGPAMAQAMDLGQTNARE